MVSEHTQKQHTYKHERTKESPCSSVVPAANELNTPSAYTTV